MQSVWALTYILYYLKLIATGFTTGYPSILKTVKDKVNDLNAALNNIGEEDKLNSFINKYNDVFNNEQQLSEEEITACKSAPDYESASILLEKIKAEKRKK